MFNGSVDLNSLNNDCIRLTQELRNLVDFISETEYQFYRVSTLSFAHHSKTVPNEIGEKQDLYVLRQIGSKFSRKIPEVKDDFKGIWNPLKTKFPEGSQYQDLREELEVYELLDENKPKSRQLLDEVRKRLTVIRERLHDTIKLVEQEMGLGAKAWKMIVGSEFYDGGTERMYRIKDEKYMKGLRFEMEIELEHERSLEHVENFQPILERYFEPVKMPELEKRTHKKNNLNSFLKGSNLVQEKEEKELLLKWISENGIENVEEKTNLLYRGSRDGYSSKIFHSKCDNKGKTLVIVKSTNKRVFGGFSNVSWHSQGGFVVDKEMKSFIFSLNEKEKYKLLVDEQAILSLGTFGPVFGDRGNLLISKNCNLNPDSFSDISSRSYAIPTETTLAGTKTFQVEDIEVWGFNPLEA